MLSRGWLFDGTRWICRRDGDGRADDHQPLGIRATAAASRQRVGNPVDDIEQQERGRKTLARDFVDTTRSPLARFHVHCNGILLSRPSVAAAATSQTLHQTAISSVLYTWLSVRVLYAVSQIDAPILIADG